MNKFEIFIPAQDASSFNMTLKVNADTWMAALKLGLAKLQLPIVISDVVVEMREDQSIHVTEPGTGRQFRITEVADAPVPVNTTVKSTVVPPLVVPSPVVQVQPTHHPGPPVKASPPSGEAAFLQALTPAPSAPTLAAPAPTIAFTQAPQTPVLQAQAQAPKQSAPKPTTPKPAAKAATVAPPSVAPPSVAPQTIAQQTAVIVPPRDEAHEDRMVSAFHRVTDIVARVKSPAEAANAFLDAAMELLPAEAGALFFANIAEKDLCVAAARGPSATYALAQRVPMGQGIVGTAVEAGMPIGAINVTTDPRYSPHVPEALGVRPDTIASSPVQKEGRTFGALHLVNRRAKGGFTADELELLAYLSDQLAEFLERCLAIAA